MRGQLTTAWLFAIGLSLVSAGVGADLDEAHRLYTEARATEDLVARTDLLRRSLLAQETFEAQLALGESLHQQALSTEALTALKRALELAGTPKAQARVLYALGECYVTAGERQEGMALMRRSLEQHEYPQVRDRLRTLDLESAAAPMSSAEIQRSLTGTATRAFGVEPSVTLRIGFALNSADLDDAGRKQARELGRALSGEDLAGRNFKIVGHTDKQGDADHNERLSLRRAETVRSFLVAEFRLDAQRLLAEGRGEKNLLYPGDTSEDHALNRRVEVTVPR